MALKLKARLRRVRTIISKQKFFKGKTNRTQLWLTGHGLVPHRTSGALMPMPCQRVFA